MDVVATVTSMGYEEIRLKPHKHPLTREVRYVDTGEFVPGFEPKEFANHREAIDFRSLSQEDLARGVDAKVFDADGKLVWRAKPSGVD